MANTQNQQDNEERREQEANKAASEKMARNNDTQSNMRDRNQNELTQSKDPSDDASSLLNNDEKGQTNDSVSMEKQNKRKLKDEQDEDFGSEQLQ